MEKILTRNRKRYLIPRKSFEKGGINVLDAALMDMVVKAEVLKDQMTLSIKKASVVLVISSPSLIISRPLFPALQPLYVLTFWSATAAQPKMWSLINFETNFMQILSRIEKVNQSYTSHHGIRNEKE